MQNLMQHIASSLKMLRQERGWSLDKTAALTGVSKAMLGQIEREESSPTIATLWKIANGLQVSFASFFTERTECAETEPAPLYGLHQVQNRSIIPGPLKIKLLFPFEHRLKCELFALELAPQSEHLSQAHKPQVVEHVIVTEGTLEVLANGAWRRLEQGRGLRFDADQSHGYRNPTPTITRFHNIIHYPS